MKTERGGRKFILTEEENGRPHTISDIIGFLTEIGDLKGFASVVAIPRRRDRKFPFKEEDYGRDLVFDIGNIYTEMFTEGEEVEF